MVSLLMQGIFFQLDEYRQPKKVVGVSILSFQLAEGQINQGIFSHSRCGWQRGNHLDIDAIPVCVVRFHQGH